MLTRERLAEQVNRQIVREEEEKAKIQTDLSILTVSRIIIY